MKAPKRTALTPGQVMKISGINPNTLRALRASGAINVPTPPGCHSVFSPEEALQVCAFAALIGVGIEGAALRSIMSKFDPTENVLSFYEGHVAITVDLKPSRFAINAAMSPAEWCR